MKQMFCWPPIQLTTSDALASELQMEAGQPMDGSAVAKEQLRNRISLVILKQTILRPRGTSVPCLPGGWSIDWSLRARRPAWR